MYIKANHEVLIIIYSSFHGYLNIALINTFKMYINNETCTKVFKYLRDKILALLKL